MSQHSETANETWENPTAARTRLGSLAQGIALTASFVTLLVKRAYGSPHPARATKRPTPQLPATTPSASAPSR